MIPQAETSRTEVLYGNVPRRFTRRPQWVCWRYEEREGRPTKVPFTPGTNRRASTTDLLTWTTFEEAVDAYEKGAGAGIGFVLCSADPFVGIDLDDARDPKTGKIASWAGEIINSISDKYAEVSPSGKGIHILTRGRFKDGIKTKHIEIYGQDRFFTVTGRAI